MIRAGNLCDDAANDRKTAGDFHPVDPFPKKNTDRAKAEQHLDPVMTRP